MTKNISIIAKKRFIKLNAAGIKQAAKETQALSHLSGWHVQINYNAETGDVWGVLKTQNNRTIFNDAIHSFFATTPLSQKKIREIITDNLSSQND